MQRAAVSNIVTQHVEDAAILFGGRTSLLTAPHVQLHRLRRIDDRLAAHLDGVAIAGDAAWPLCDAALELPSPGSLFVAAVRAVEERREDVLERIYALALAVPETQPGLRAAFMWVEPAALRGIVTSLLGSPEAFRRALGVAASAMHRVDPNLGPARLLEDTDAVVRAAAHRAAGELGKREFLSRLAAAIHDDDPVAASWAAWSAVMLGDRHGALERAIELARVEGEFRRRALPLALMAMPLSQAHELLRALAQDPAQIRWLIKGAGIVGDATYVPWLIKHMSDGKLARLAGESFSVITGADLAALDLEGTQPEGVEVGPNDDPNDANVELDEDEDLSWPDPERIERWWGQNGHRFVPGQRYFLGAAVQRSHCIHILKTGYQRQRILAAHHLCLLEPGSVLFEWRAPAWRQTRALAALA